MRRLDGNSVLIIGSDKNYNEELFQCFRVTGAQASTAITIENAIITLNAYDFDIVICDYYLSDGMIHEVIEWCRENLEFLPIFVAVGSSIPGDQLILNRQLISHTWSKTEDNDVLIKKVQGFLFDFNKFYESLVSMIDPRGIELELIVKAKKIKVAPIELDQDGIFISVEEFLAEGTFGLLRISLFESEWIENFTLIGSLGVRRLGGQQFRINECYATTWTKLISRLNERQISITGFLSKATGN